MSHSFQQLKRSCSICNGARPDCRKNLQTDLIHCRHDVIGSPPGFRFIGIDKIGFNMWAADDGRERDSSLWETQRLQRVAERERLLADERERNAQSLDADERDRNIRRIHAQIGLSTSHRQNLRDRGLSDSQIDAGKFFSIAPWQEVTGINSRLAGVDLSGQKLLIGQSGIGCPVYDVQGRIISWQTRFDNPIDGGKYKWPTSRSSKRPNGGTAHLPNSELPLGCYRPLDGVKLTSVGLAEGFLKPYITAQRLGQVFIGAAGGNFASSPQQLRTYLETLAVELDTKVIDLYPDAGAVVNKNVLRHYERSIELVRSWGYTVRIAWWGQLNKSYPDIDELKNTSAIAYITPEEFFHQFHQDALIPELELKEIANSEIYKELTGLTEKPWKEINTPKLDLESLSLEPGAIYIICSPKGTSKTNSLIPFTPKFSNIYAWFSRIALGREECARIGLDWKDDLKAWSGGLKVGFCADSAFSFNPGLLQNNGLLLIDELDQVCEHSFGDTCNKGGKRPLILAALKAQIDAVIAGNGMALLMSADVADKEVAYIKQLAPNGCPVRLIVNHYKPNLGKVHFYESDTPDALIEDMLQDLEQGRPCFAIDDIKDGVRGCKSIADYIRSVHPEWAKEIVEINSDTSGDPAVIDYLRNINTASENTRLLCCSPSVTSGVSIENGHFKRVYGFSNGVLTVSNASQSIARVRGAELIKLWAAERGLVYTADRSLFPEQIKAYYKRNYEANCKHILGFNAQYQPLTDEWTSPHFDLFCKNAAYRNNCMVRLRERLRERLIDEGYQVETVASAGSDMVKEGLKESWSRTEINHAHAVAAANVLSDEQLKALEENPQALTPEQKLDVEKTYLLKTYGQELVDIMVYEHRSGQVLTGWAAMVLKDNRGEYRRQLEAFYLLTCAEEVACAKDLKAEQRQLEHKAGRFAGDVRWFTRQRKAREFLGLHKFLNPEIRWNLIDFADLAQKAKKHFGHVKDALGFSVQKMTKGQIFGELMRQIGLDLEKTWVSNPSSKGNRYKQRRITPESWQYAQAYVKYRLSLNPELAASTATVADHPPVTISSEVLGGGDQGLSHTGQGIEVVPKSDFVAKEIGEPPLASQMKLESQSAGSTQSADVPQEITWGVSLPLPGTIVEWFGRAGRWTIKYCTGVVAKVVDCYGQEVMASCKDLRLVETAA